MYAKKNQKQNNDVFFLLMAITFGINCVQAKADYSIGDAYGGNCNYCGHAGNMYIIATSGSTTCTTAQAFAYAHKCTCTKSANDKTRSICNDASSNLILDDNSSDTDRK